MTNWYAVTTPEEEERLLGAWSDAPIENLEVLALILEVARDQVIAYAPREVGAQTLQTGTWDPSLPASVKLSGPMVIVERREDGTPLLARISAPQVPANLLYAQLQQARNLWNAGAAGAGGDIGADGYSFTPRPLDKTIRSIIRPTTGAADAF